MFLTTNMHSEVQCRPEPVTKPEPVGYPLSRTAGSLYRGLGSTQCCARPEGERRFRWEGEQFLSSGGMAFGLERNVFHRRAAGVAATLNNRGEIYDARPFKAVSGIRLRRHRRASYSTCCRSCQESRISIAICRTESTHLSRLGSSLSRSKSATASPRQRRGPGVRCCRNIN